MLLRLIAGAILCALAALLPGQLQAQTAPPLTVFAAASMREWLDGLGAKWAKDGKPALRFVYGASGTLARQIENGAPADLFISADQPWMDYLAEKKGIPRERRRIIASNRLVVIAERGSSRRITLSETFDESTLHAGDRIAIGDPRSVPAGAYAREALEKLNLWDKVLPRLVMVENVRFALAMVARGDVGTGIVYASDAVAEPAVHVIGIVPETLHKPIGYHAARMPGAGHPDAGAFFAYLESPFARESLARLGFLPPD